MKLESLANELLFDIFDYLSRGHILRSFQSLNSRFNQLISTYLQLTRCLDLRSMSFNDSDIFFHFELSNIVNRITSIIVSNGNDTPFEIEYFRCNNFHFRHFINLQSLSLYNIHSQMIMKEISLEWDYLPYLIYIKLIDCCLPSNDNDNQSLIDKIWNMTKLRNFYISPRFCRENQQICPSVNSSSIKYLSIENFNCDRNLLSNMLHYTSHLRCLHIYSYFGSEITSMPLLPLLVTLKVDQRCSSISSNRSQTDKLEMFLQKLPNLCNLTVKSLSMFMDGYRWENIINNYLSKLKIFQCTMAIDINGLGNLKKSVNDLLCSFHNEFWLEKTQWFIRCHLQSNNQGGYYILYYTLPYCLISSISLNDYFWSGSTRPSEHDYWMSESVYDSFVKIHSSIEFSNSDNLVIINCCERIMNMFRLSLKKSSLNPSSVIARKISNLTNTSELYLNLPFGEHISKFIPQLDQLTLLYVHLTTDYTNQSDLRILLNQAPNLCSLAVNCSTKIAFKYFLADIKHLSIDKISLPKIISLANGIFYNLGQCIAFSHSPLGKQCQVLTIGVQNQECIIKLVNKMSNLRFLMVESYEEGYSFAVSAQKKRYNLIAWLKSTLPTTIRIEDHDCCEKFVKIWIR